MPADDLVDAVRLVIDRGVEQVAHARLGALGPQIEDLVIPADVQAAGPGGPE